MHSYSTFQMMLIIFAFLTVRCIAVSNTLYASFQRYTNFSAAAYASSCPTPPYGATVVQYIVNETADAHATLFQDASAEEFIIAFKGTNDVQTFIADVSQAFGPFDTVGVNCADCEVQASYLTLWNSISSTVISTLATQMAANPTYTLTVTGHSLGAALAAFSSASFTGLGMNFTTYTFGEPRVGNPTFANLIDSLRPSGTMFRVTHANDGVPQANPTSLGYRHHSIEYWQSQALTEDASDTVECTGQEPPDCNNSELGIGIGPEGLGINAAHLFYSDIVIGNPFDGGATACSG